MTTHQFSANLTGRDARDYVEEGAAFLAMVGSGSAVATKRQPAAREPVALSPKPQRVDVVVIGGGQAGLSVGYHLKRHNVSFVILEANARIGDTWRRRWDFAAAVHTGPLRQPRRHAVSGAQPVLSDQGRDGRLSRGLCDTVFVARAHRRQGRARRAQGRPLPRQGRGSFVRRRACGRGDGQLPVSANSRLCRRSRSGHRAAAIPAPTAAPRS